MLVRHLQECTEIIAGDGTHLRELLHPERQATAARYSIAHAVVLPTEQSMKHCLLTSEVYYVLRGTGMMHINEESEAVNAGDVIDIPPHSIQWIKNSGEEPLEFLCIVDPAWCVEDEEVATQ